MLAETESASHSARLLFLFHKDIFYVYSFTKLKSDHSVFFKFRNYTVRFRLNLLMLHVCSIFVCIMIKMQWLLLILNGKITDKALFCLYEEIFLFVLLIYLIWGLF